MYQLQQHYSILLHLLVFRFALLLMLFFSIYLRILLRRATWKSVIIIIFWKECGEFVRHFIVSVLSSAQANILNRTETERNGMEFKLREQKEEVNGIVIHTLSRADTHPKNNINMANMEKEDWYSKLSTQCSRVAIQLKLKLKSKAHALAHACMLTHSVVIFCPLIYVR